MTPPIIENKPPIPFPGPAAIRQVPAARDAQRSALLTFVNAGGRAATYRLAVESGPVMLLTAVVAKVDAIVISPMVGGCQSCKEDAAASGSPAFGEGNILGRRT